MADRGKLIVFEGIDGVGKSTLCAKVYNHFLSKGIPCILTFEPTNGKWGRLLRSSFSGNRLSPKEELGLFIKDRREHVEKVINPAIEQGKIVICDRYYLSTMAYQGARGFDIEDIRKKNEQFAPLPDVAFILQLTVEEAIERISKKRGDRLNSFENYEYLKKVADVFNTFDFPWVKKLDASLSLDTLFKQVIDIINNLDC